MNSSVMSGYGAAMGRANIDAVSIKELPMALVHTREVGREPRARILPRAIACAVVCCAGRTRPIAQNSSWLPLQHLSGAVNGLPYAALSTAVRGKPRAHTCISAQAIMMSEKQRAKLQEALDRNKGNVGMCKEITRKIELVDKHMADLRSDERLIQKRQDKASGKKLNGKSIF